MVHVRQQLALQVLDGVSHYRGLKLNRELGNYVERGYLHEFPECNRVVKLRHPAILIHGSAIVQQGSVNEERRPSSCRPASASR